MWIKTYNNWIKKHLKGHIDRHDVKEYGPYENTILFYDKLDSRIRPTLVNIFRYMQTFIFCYTLMLTDAMDTPNTVLVDLVNY